MTLIIYIMLVKMYCETIGSYKDLGMYLLIGLVMWSGHCAAKYLCK
jgi:hypothetical protein|nr:MAG TPA: hypothetical protein [Caudoviricetes sp.]